MLDRLKRHLEEFVQALVGRRLRFAFMYPGTVVGQAPAPDQAVEVLLDDSTVRGVGQQAILVRHGMPGVTARIAVGQRVVLAFEAGDPSKPFIVSYDEGSANAEELEVNAQTAINVGDASGGATMHESARKTDTVSAGTWTITPGAGIVTITYTPLNGTPTVVTIAATALVATIVSGPMPFTANGEITSGSAKVNVED